jgi:hypothetical protein
VELLTLQIRLLICSIDKAEQIGLDWWRHDPNLTTRARAVDEDLRKRLSELERAVKRLDGGGSARGSGVAGSKTETVETKKNKRRVRRSQT